MQVYHIHFIGLCFGSMILVGHSVSRRAPVTVESTTVLDRLLTALPALGMFIAPIVYTRTSWLDWASYQLGAWSLVPGVVFLVLGLWLLWRAHADLGRHWSAGLQIRRGQKVIRTGVFRYIRHPLYAAYFLWAFSQPLLIHNWFAGFSMLVSFVPVYAYRVAREEQMMRGHFPEYCVYAQNTDRLWPWKLLARIWDSRGLARGDQPTETD